jgi:hypothetical protein
MLEKLERQNAFLSRPCSLKEYTDDKIVLFSFKIFSLRFILLDSKPTLIGSKSLIHSSTIWTKTYISVRRKSYLRYF